MSAFAPISRHIGIEEWPNPDCSRPRATRKSFRARSHLLGNLPAAIEPRLGPVGARPNLPKIPLRRELCKHLNLSGHTTRFAKIYPQRLQFWVDVVRKGVEDPNHLLKHKHPVHGHTEVPNDLDLQKVKDLVEQSYKSTIV